ncbi:unnamed protein product [Psylliodes chrysocephalus]|uniref:Uncharacterized protein n=1 Tax=Psylliodes chrysocephalus TaxID=3402493 RepID=A0A9P0CEU2_9CUCU|nr:unnamed protein product [Psylliodes chrysocephala]
MAFAAARMILKDKRRKPSKEEYIPIRNRSKIPSHQGITGKEKALANLGRSVSRATFPSGHYKDVINSIKVQSFEEWCDSFEKNWKVQRSYMCPIHKKPKKSPWLKEYTDTSRKEICIISRMRANHCLTRSYLNTSRLKMIPNDLCDCGQSQDLQHICFSCSTNQHNIDNLHKSMKIPKNIYGSFSVFDLVFRLLNKENIKIISGFLIAFNIKL